MLVCPLCRIVLGPNESVCPRDGQTGQEAVLHPLAPALAERFKVVEPFALGATGTLYLADEPESGRRGLLKVLAPLPAHVQGERQRLRRELVKQATLDSALLVSPLSTGEQEGRLWLFREWVEGVSLKVRLARQGALPPEQALAIAAQLTVALDELHRAGLLHRDLKPGHVLLEPHTEGLTRVRLLDAGVCAPVGETESSTLVGTPGYIAPEQLAGKLVSFRSDLYALGGVLYEMLTGRPAFTGESPAEVLSAQRAGELPELPTDLPSGVAPLLKSLLAKDPQDRPFSAQKVRKTLDAYLPDGAAVTKQPTKTFATVSEPRHAVPREPTGTLRPPPAPPSAPRAAQVTGGKFSAPSPRVSAPPPSPPGAASRDSTQRLELEQILEASPMKPRVSAPPPPPPSAAPGRQSKAPGRRSVPPPPRANTAQRDPTEAIDLDEVLVADEASPAPAEPIPADHTQPIRLEQVLAVAEARARTSAPPAHLPAPGSAAKAGPADGPQGAQAGAARVSAQRAEAPAPTPEPAARPSAAPQGSSSALPSPSAAAHVAQTPSSALPSPSAAARGPSEPPEDATMNVTLSELSAVRQPEEQASPSDASLAQTLELPATRAPAAAPSGVNASMVAPPDHHDDDTEGEEATSVAFRPAALAMTGGRAHAAESANAEVEARSSTTMSSEDYEDTQTPGFDFGNHPLRRYVPHAAAALVLLGLGGALVSAMGSDDEADKAVAALEKPADPGVGAAAPEKPTPSVMPLAAAPKPTVAPLAKEQAKTDPKAAPTEQAEPPGEAQAVAGGSGEDSAARPAEPAAKEVSARTAPAARKATRARAARNQPARAAARKSSKIDEKRWAEARDAARAHYAAKRYKQAAQAYEQAARHNPTHAGTFAGLGASRLSAGDVTGAVQAYKTAIRLSPNTSGFHAALGRAYATAGDKAQARAAYKKALALDPKNAAARDALKRL